MSWETAGLSPLKIIKDSKISTICSNVVKPNLSDSARILKGHMHLHTKERWNEILENCWYLHKVFFEQTIVQPRTKTIGKKNYVLTSLLLIFIEHKSEKLDATETLKFNRKTDFPPPHSRGKIVNKFETQLTLVWWISNRQLSASLWTPSCMHQITYRSESET